MGPLPGISWPGLSLALATLCLLPILPPLMLRLLRRWNRLEPNFRGERIPQSFGIVILLCSSLLLVLAMPLYPSRFEDCLTWLLAVGGYGLLGLIDDVRGDKRIKGLRGHFRAAFRQGVITTGFIKAVGGALLALFLGWRLHGSDYGSLLRAAALIALSANAINLLDLRPGRAGGIFLILMLPLVFYAYVSGAIGIGLPLPLLVVLPALVVWERDARAAVMMGDTGSNLLGGTLGLSLALYTPPTAQLIALLLLVLLHIAAERVSLTRVIEGNRLLRTLDRLTGVR